MSEPRHCRFTLVPDMSQVWRDILRRSVDNLKNADASHIECYTAPHAPVARLDRVAASQSGGLFLSR